MASPFAIFIIFHSFFIIEPNLYNDIPIKNNITVLNFHTINIMLHILPLLYSINVLINYYININIFDVLYNYLHIIIWLIYNKFNSIYSIKYVNCIKFLILIIFFNILLGIIFSKFCFRHVILILLSFIYIAMIKYY